MTPKDIIILYFTKLSVCDRCEIKGKHINKDTAPRPGHTECWTTRLTLNHSRWKGNLAFQSGSSVLRGSPLKLQVRENISKSTLNQNTATWEILRLTFPHFDILIGFNFPLPSGGSEIRTPRGARGTERQPEQDGPWASSCSLKLGDKNL